MLPPILPLVFRDILRDQLRAELDAQVRSQFGPLMVRLRTRTLLTLPPLQVRQEIEARQQIREAKVERGATLLPVRFLI